MDSNSFSIKNLLISSLKEIKNNLSNLLLIAVFIYLPINIALAFLIPSSKVADVYGLRGYPILYEFLVYLIKTIALMSCAYAINFSFAKGQRASLKDLLFEPLKLAPMSLLTNLMFLLLLIPLSALLLIPGIIFATYCFFTPFIVILRHKFLLNALKYSKNLVKGRAWKTFQRLIVLTLVFYAPYFIFMFLVQFVPKGLVYDVALETVLDFFGLFAVVSYIVLFLVLDESSAN